jgi:hypothetical protein
MSFSSDFSNSSSRISRMSAGDFISPLVVAILEDFADGTWSLSSGVKE